MVCTYADKYVMRHLIDLVEYFDSNQPLDEARGLSARKPGEQFQRVGSDDESDTITFRGLDFYPSEGSYDSSEEMLEVYEKLISKLPIAPEAVNKPNASTKAFGLAKFTTSVGDRYLVKFAQKINPIREKNTFWQTSDIPGGFSQVSARGAKEKIGYKPSDVLTQFKSQTPNSIAKQVYNKFGVDSPIGKAMQIFMQADSFPVIIPGEGIDFAAFRDYFCEMLQPIALMKNMPVQGNAGQAAEVFLGGDYSDCVVSFNEGVSGALYDSLMVAPNGKQIKLSSKGAKGAMASVINLLKSAQELNAAGLGRVVDQYEDVMEILKIIDNGDHYTGPLKLAERLDLITPQESNIVMSLRNVPQATPVEDIPQLTKNLRQLYRDRTAANPDAVIPLEHMVSSIAYKVVNTINTTTNFSDAAADILNNSAFVQMYTEAAKKGNDIILKGFKTVWPSKLFTEVTLEAQKSYSSTASSGGKLVFNINKEPKAVANADDSSGGEPGTDSNVADNIPASSGIEPRGNRSKITARGTRQGDDSSLGRKRRS